MTISFGKPLLFNESTTMIAWKIFLVTTAFVLSFYCGATKVVDLTSALLLFIIALHPFVHAQRKGRNNGHLGISIHRAAQLAAMHISTTVLMDLNVTKFAISHYVPTICMITCILEAMIPTISNSTISSFLILFVDIVLAACTGMFRNSLLDNSSRLSNNRLVFFFSLRGNYSSSVATLTVLLIAFLDPLATVVFDLVLLKTEEDDAVHVQEHLDDIV